MRFVGVVRCTTHFCFAEAYTKGDEILANKTIAGNNKARHDYHILEEYEAGIELCGTEVKSLRAGRVNLKDSYAEIIGGEIYVHGMHISPYEFGNINNVDPMRKRRLLMHKSEILRLFGKLRELGLTLVPLSLYFKGSRIKMSVALCKGKKLYDKRETEKERDAGREMRRAVKERQFE